MSKKFNRFSKESLAFLSTVKRKNSKEWFQENRDKYEEYLLEPFRMLVSELGSEMLEIDPEFEIRPLINKTISKIFRDTRFSKDKSFFKNQMWLTFKRPSKEWKDAPAYFFELMTDSYRYGLGYYSASRNRMDIFRESIDANPKEFIKAISFYGKHSPLQLKGDIYKRPLKGKRPEIIQNWYQRKSFYLVCTKKIDKTLFSAKLKTEIIKSFKTLSPLYKYLYKHIQIEDQ